MRRDRRLTGTTVRIGVRRVRSRRKEDVRRKRKKRRCGSDDDSDALRSRLFLLFSLSSLLPVHPVRPSSLLPVLPHPVPLLRPPLSSSSSSAQLLRRPPLPPDMALLLAAARVVGNCFTRTVSPVVCSPAPQLQVQPSRELAKFKCRRKRHREKLALVYVPGRPSLHPVEKFKNLYSGEAGVPVLPIAGTGGIFSTEIKRRTTIRDPNLPKARPFEPQKECLQWTDWRMLRDVNRRIATAELHPTRQNLICVRKGHQLPLELREQAFKELVHKIPLKAAPGGVANRCVITSRGRGRFKMFRLSRIFWRLQADYNKISGAIKSTWGP